MEIDGISLLEVIAPVVFPAAFKSTIMSYRELILEGAAMPTEMGVARQFLEDRELELRKVFWNLVYLIIAPGFFNQDIGSSDRATLH